MSLGQFAERTLITFTSRVLSLILGIAISILVARILGPEGKGIYALALLLPALIIALTNLGIAPATVYHVARARYSRPEILGNNILIGLGIGAVGVVGGLIVALFFHQSIFPGTDQGYLILALAIIPGGLLFSYMRMILLGDQKIIAYNMIEILYIFLFLVFIVIVLWRLQLGVAGALLAGALAWLLVDVFLFFWTKKAVGGISFKLNLDYLREASVYGIQAHLGNIIAFLNYRIDMFLVNGFLNPAAVGFYSIAVGLVEKLWLLSFSASTVLFPKVAAETDEQRRKEFTPLVARNVLWVTALGALVIFFLSRWIVELFYTAAFLPAVRPLQILLVGIVAGSASRVLANDIAGRGRPILNTYVSAGALATNVILNLIWIPRYGIAGAAWATTFSYSLTSIARLVIYCQLSGNSWIIVILPQPMDLVLYRRALTVLGQRLKVQTSYSLITSSRER